MVKELKVVCPVYVTLKMVRVKDKRIYLNQNTYRNLHRFTEGKCKVTFTELMKEQLKDVKLQTPVKITYKVFKQSKRRLDKMNVVSIVSKYLLDALTYYECIEDDNDVHIKEELIVPTELDRDNPRVEVLFKSI